MGTGQVEQADGGARGAGDPVQSPFHQLHARWIGFGGRYVPHVPIVSQLGRVLALGRAGSLTLSSGHHVDLGTRPSLVAFWQRDHCAGGWEPAR